MKHKAHRKAGYWEYRGYALEKPEGSACYNIYKISEVGIIDWASPDGYAESFSEAKKTVDMML